MELYFWIIIGALLLVSLTIYFARPPPNNTNTYNYDNLEIGFNAKYLLDIAAQIQGKEIEILLSDSASPALITDPDQDGVIFVLMPMRV